MALRNLYFCFLTALLAVNLIFADESNDTQPHDRASFPFNPFGSNPFGSLPFGFNPFGLNFSQFIPFGFGSSRQTRDVSSQDSSSTNNVTNNDPSGRLFFSLGSRLTTCNYTNTPGISCASCYQALTCLSSNVGIIRRCTLYCNSGRCSFVAGSQCFNSTG